MLALSQDVQTVPNDQEPSKRDCSAICEHPIGDQHYDRQSSKYTSAADFTLGLRDVVFFLFRVPIGELILLIGGSRGMERRKQIIPRHTELPHFELPRMLYLMAFIADHSLCVYS